MIVDANSRRLTFDFYEIQAQQQFAHPRRQDARLPPEHEAPKKVRNGFRREEIAHKHLEVVIERRAEGIWEYADCLEDEKECLLHPITPKFVSLLV